MDKRIQIPNLCETLSAFLWQDVFLLKTWKSTNQCRGELAYIALRCWGKEEPYGLWLTSQRQQITTNNSKRHGKIQPLLQKPHHSNYHILTCGSTLNYFTVIIRLLMQCRIGRYTNLVYTLSNLMEMEHLEGLTFFKQLKRTSSI